MESIYDPNNQIIAASSLALADLDNDGTVEIVANRAIVGMVAFKWNAAASKYETWWSTVDSQYFNVTKWAGPAIHDINDDG